MAAYFFITSIFACIFTKKLKEESCFFVRGIWNIAAWQRLYRTGRSSLMPSGSLLYTAAAAEEEKQPNKTHGAKYERSAISLQKETENISSPPDLKETAKIMRHDEAHKNCGTYCNGFKKEKHVFTDLMNWKWSFGWWHHHPAFCTVDSKRHQSSTFLWEWKQTDFNSLDCPQSTKSTNIKSLPLGNHVILHNTWAQHLPFPELLWDLWWSDHLRQSHKSLHRTGSP